MSDFTRGVNFTVKDGLITGDTNKIIKGTEIDDEFNLARTAINSKADAASPALTGSGTAVNLTVSGTLDVSSGTLTLADDQVAEAKVSGLTEALALKAPLAGPTFTGTTTVDNLTATGTVVLPDASLAIADTSGLQAALDAKAAAADFFELGTSNIATEITTFEDITTFEERIDIEAGARETIETWTGTPKALTMANGSIKKQTLAANTTYTDSMSDGDSITLLIDTPSYTITWPTIEWVGGSQPDIDTSNTMVIVVWKADSILSGLYVGALS